MHHGKVSSNIAKGLLALRKRIEDAKIPPSALDQGINVAIYNIRELGKVRRSLTSSNLRRPVDRGAEPRGNDAPSRWRVSAHGLRPVEEVRLCPKGRAAKRPGREGASLPRSSWARLIATPAFI